LNLTKHPQVSHTQLSFRSRERERKKTKLFSKQRRRRRMIHYLWGHLFFDIYSWWPLCGFFVVYLSESIYGKKKKKKNIPRESGREISLKGYIHSDILNGMVINNKANEE